MARFLIDANLPYRFALWQGEDYLHVYDLGDDMLFSPRSLWFQPVFQIVGKLCRRGVSIRRQL